MSGSQGERQIGQGTWAWMCGNGQLPSPGQIRARSDKGTDFQGLSTGENLVLETDCCILSQLCHCGTRSGHFISRLCPP